MVLCWWQEKCRYRSLRLTVKNSFFATDGNRLKADFGDQNANGSRSYYHGATGNKLSQPSFSLLETTTGTMLMPKVNLLLANRRSTAVKLYFDQTGKQVKGATAANPDGSISTMMFIQGKRLLIVGLKFLQGQWVYFLTLKEKGYVSRLMNERSQSLL